MSLSVIASLYFIFNTDKSKILSVNFALEKSILRKVSFIVIRGKYLRESISISSNLECK